MTDNPLMRPMTTVLDKSVKAAKWLDSSEWSAGVALARAIAGQIDDVVEGGHVTDPEVLKQLHMRIIPNYQRALFTLGLTPEGYARTTGVGAAPRSGTRTGDGVGDVPAGVATPFSAAQAAVDPLDALIAAEVERTNVIDMNGRR